MIQRGGSCEQKGRWHGLTIIHRGYYENWAQRTYWEVEVSSSSSLSSSSSFVVPSFQLMGWDVI